jgi:hypothetical protein
VIDKIIFHLPQPVDCPSATITQTTFALTQLESCMRVLPTGSAIVLQFAMSGNPNRNVYVKTSAGMAPQYSETGALLIMMRSGSTPLPQAECS